MTTTKTAVDQTAINYWTKYFEDSGYGALWVKKMPQRLKAALFQREAALADAHDQAITILGHGITPSAVTVDGQFVALGHDAAGAPVRLSRGFTATFDHDGRLQKFDAVVTP